MALTALLNFYCIDFFGGAYFEILYPTRYQMNDWEAKALAEALALRHKLPSLIPLQSQYLNSRDWGHKVCLNVNSKFKQWQINKTKDKFSYCKLLQRCNLSFKW